MKDIFSEITFKDGEKIIELLKKYQTTEVILKPNSKM
jgi:Mor family transcriptional regulator